MDDRRFGAIFPQSYDYEALRAKFLEDQLVRNLHADRVPLSLSHTMSPTMAASFSPRHAHNLLLGFDSGEVSLVDCRRSTLYEEAPQSKQLHGYPAQITDLTWISGSYALAVADNHAYVHEEEAGAVKNCLKYHRANIKSLRFRPNNPNILATAGRDGDIAIWDLRLTDTNSAKNKPVNALKNVHQNKDSRKKNSSAPSVIACEFLPLEDHLLASIGQPDYSIRFWDLRNALRNAKRNYSVPCEQINAPLTGRRQRSFVSICIDSIGENMYAVSQDNHLYKYLLSNFSSTPVDVFSAPGFRTSGEGSFYIRSALSPCDQYLACGTSKGNPIEGQETKAHAFILSTNVKQSRAIRLEEHSIDVSCVAWSHDGQYLFAGGEDHSSRIWYKSEDEFFGDPVRFVQPKFLQLEPRRNRNLRIAKKSMWIESLPFFIPSPVKLFDWPDRCKIASLSPNTRIPRIIPMNPVTICINPRSKQRQLKLDSFLSSASAPPRIIKQPRIQKSMAIEKNKAASNN